MYTHKFEIKAGELTCRGTITATNNGMGYYEYDEDSARPNSELDNTLSEIISKVGEYLKANGSLEKFEIKVKE